MDIKQNDTVVFSLTETCIKILKHDLPSATINESIAHYMQHGGVIQKRKSIIKRLKSEWVDGGKLAANGVTSIPLDDTELATLIFDQTGEVTHVYKDRDARDAEI